MLNKRRVNRDDILVGRPLHHDIYDVKGMLLLKNGFMIDSQQQIDLLIERGVFIISDGTSGKAPQEKKSTHS